MYDRENARATAKSHITRETTLQFDIALHNAVESSIQSMTLLHSAVCDCVNALKAADVGPVDMILAMKICALDSSARYHPEFDEIPVSNVNTLLDQIVKWAIAEYYTTRT
jgi:hypothetical protein